MDKTAIIQSICGQFSSMGIPYSTGSETDIYIKTEFLDAGFSTGNRKITYEALVFFNEELQTAFMWEKTTEAGQGISFGSGSGSYFQSGKTLFRKVRSIQYAPDGKAYEYTLDLGAIPKAVKNTAKTNGWKFKTVLKRDKALYPAGYTPVPETQYKSGGKPAEQYTDNKKPFYAKSSPPVKYNGKIAANNIGLVIFAVVITGLVILGNVSIPGILSLYAVFIIHMVLTRKLVRKGCFTVILLWILSLAAVLLILVYTSDYSDVETTNMFSEKVADRMLLKGH